MVVARFAGWMHSRGHKVTVFGLKDARLLDELPPGVEGVVVSKASRLPFLAGWRLARICKQKGIRQLIATTSPSIFVVSMAGKYDAQLKTWYWQHMQIGHPKKDFLHTWFYKSLERWITLMPWLKDEVTMTTCMPAERIEVLPLGIEMQPFDNLDRAVEARRKARIVLGLPEKKVLFGMIGRLDPNKKQGLLLEAFALLPENYKKEISLVFIGAPTIGHSEGYPAELQALAERLDIRNDMILLPFHEKIEQVYAALDFLVMGTHSETYGLVTIEAMAAAIPVIGAAGGSTVQLLNPNWKQWPYDIVEVDEFRSSGFLDVQGGVLFRPDDRMSLNKALQFALASKNQLEKKAQQIAPKIREQYSHHVMLEKFEKLFASRVD